MDVDDYTNAALTARSRLTRTPWFHTLWHVSFYYVFHFIIIAFSVKI